MHKIAITGHPGSGKSKVRKLLEEFGAITIDLDKIARDLLSKDTIEYDAVVEAFGHSVLFDNGEIDRWRLRMKIMRNENDLAILNAIMHPSIDATYKNMIGELPFSSTVVVEIPLLTHNDDGYFDTVVLVVADKAVKIERIMKRDHCSAHDADALLALHPSDKERKKFATFVIDNN